MNDSKLTIRGELTLILVVIINSLGVVLAFEIVLWRCAHGCGNYRRICLAKHPAPRPGQP